MKPVTALAASARDSGAVVTPDWRAQRPGRPFPPRRPRPGPPPPTPGKGPGFWITHALIVIALILANPPSRPTAIPAELAGVWRTDAPRYANRQLIFRANTVTFQTAEHGAAVSPHVVVGVRVRPYRDRGMLYEVTYAEPEAPRSPMYLEFVYYNGVPSTLVLRNQPEFAWRRVAE